MTPPAASSKTCRARSTAAIAGNFAIEVDIQLSADGEAMVHHDDELGRLTEGAGALLDKTAAELKAVAFKDTPERMMTLGDLCALVAGRVPLVIEVKSHFDGDRKLVTRMAEVLAAYRGPVVGMSFDPDQVLALRELCPHLPRGIVAERTLRRRRLAGGLAGPAPRHDCICATASAPGRISSAYRVNELPAAGALDRAAHLRPAAADLDRAHTGAARTRRALCRPDDFRGFRAGNLKPRRGP